MFAGPGFMWNSKQPNISCGENTAEHKQSRKFLECIYDNFLTQMTKEPMRGGHSAGPHTYKEELVVDVARNEAKAEQVAPDKTQT